MILANFMILNDKIYSCLCEHVLTPNTFIEDLCIDFILCSHSISNFFLCAFVCVCIHREDEYIRGHVCAHVGKWQRLIVWWYLWSPGLWEHRTRQLVCTEWQESKLSALLCLPGARIKRMHQHPCHCTWVLRLELRSSCVHRKHFIDYHSSTLFFLNFSQISSLDSWYLKYFCFLHFCLF